MFDRIFAALAAEAAPPERVMIGSIHLTANRTAASLLKKGHFPRCIGRAKGGLNSKLHAVCDQLGRPMIMLLTEGQASDHPGGALILHRVPPVRHLIADRGYDSSPFRDSLAERGISACVPSTRSRKIPIPHDPVLYR